MVPILPLRLVLLLAEALRDLLVLLHWGLPHSGLLEAPHLGLSLVLHWGLVLLRDFLPSHTHSVHIHRLYESYK